MNKTYSMSMYASMEDLLTDKCKDQQNEIQRLEADLEQIKERQLWIPVSERLPETELHCVFKIPLRGYPDYCEAGFYQKGSGMICDLTGDPQSEISDATHWMPLPEPPQE